MAEVTLTLEEYEALREMAMGVAAPIVDERSKGIIMIPPKRKASAEARLMRLTNSLDLIANSSSI